MKFMLIVAMSMMSVVGVASAQNLPKYDADQDYPDVRKQLMSEGFAPITAHHGSHSGCSTEAKACKMYPELVNCDSHGDQVAVCQFDFKENSTGKKLQVFTDGEPDDDLSIHSVRWAGKAGGK